jgi:hypothetical protein
MRLLYEKPSATGLLGLLDLLDLLHQRQALPIFFLLNV